ncbi:MAG: hypothetical protein U9Q81_05050 [Pseudomonadota bacterium]|nr:hypothetical protein [Pseudomonadota bacterium]
MALPAIPHDGLVLDEHTGGGAALILDMVSDALTEMESRRLRWSKSGAADDRPEIEKEEG